MEKESDQKKIMREKCLRAYIKKMSPDADGTDTSKINPNHLLVFAFRHKDMQNFESALERGADPNVRCSIHFGAPTPLAAHFVPGSMVYSTNFYEFFKSAFEKLLEHGLDLDRQMFSESDIVLKTMTSTASKSQTLREVILHFAERSSKSRSDFAANKREYCKWLLEKLSV